MVSKKSKRISLANSGVSLRFAILHILRENIPMPMPMTILGIQKDLMIVKPGGWDKNAILLVLRDLSKAGEIEMALRDGRWVFSGKKEG